MNPLMAIITKIIISSVDQKIFQHFYHVVKNKRNNWIAKKKILEKCMKNCFNVFGSIILIDSFVLKHFLTFYRLAEASNLIESFADI